MIDIKNIGSAFSGIGDLALKIRTAIKGIDPSKQTELESLLATLENSLLAGQIEINKIEAQSESKFKSGWRPFIGWTCGISLSLNFVVNPIVQWILNLIRIEIKLFVFDLSTMLPVLLGMLGLAGYRSFEKFKGVQ